MTGAAAPRRVAFVTGSGRGIGRAVAVRLAPDHDIVVNYRRDEEAARSTEKECVGLGARVLCLQADVEDLDALDAAFARIDEEFGRLDVLVANAASTVFKPVLESEAHHVRRTMANTVESFVHLVRRTVPRMPTGGRIVAISGLDAWYAVPAHGVMGAGKAGVESLVRALAVELGPRGITVNAVNPGTIDTDSSRAYFEAAPWMRDELVAATPAGRLGTPEDVAAVAAFLCRDEAAFVNGVVIAVDGGFCAGGGPWVALARRMQTDRP